jgi:hypothetical protein
MECLDGELSKMTVGRLRLERVAIYTLVKAP